MNIKFEGFAQQGWQCPICKRVYSPFTPMCWYCGNDKQTVVTSTETDINPGHMLPINEWDNSKTVSDDVQITK